MQIESVSFLVQASTPFTWGGRSVEMENTDYKTNKTNTNKQMEESRMLEYHKEERSIDVCTNYVWWALGNLFILQEFKRWNIH